MITWFNKFQKMVKNMLTRFSGTKVLNISNIKQFMTIVKPFRLMITRIKNIPWIHIEHTLTSTTRQTSATSLLILFLYQFLCYFCISMKKESFHKCKLMQRLSMNHLKVKWDFK
jgi:hypothetical protein